MNNKQLAEEFVSDNIPRKMGRGVLNGSHMFIDGRAIYSYGYHFPIAVKLEGDIFIFNKDKYSNSTARQKNNIKTAIGNNQTILVGTNKLKEIIEMRYTSIKELMLNKIGDKDENL